MSYTNHGLQKEDTKISNDGRNDVELTTFVEESVLQNVIVEGNNEAKRFKIKKQNYYDGENNRQKIDIKLEEENNNPKREKFVEVEKCRKWYWVDKYMLPAKFAYFFQLSKDFSYQPFLVLFLTATGLSKAEAGLIAGLRLIGLILGSPIWGNITDRFHNHRNIVMLLCLASILLMCSQPLVSVFLGTNRNVCPYKNRDEARTIAADSEEFTSKLFFVMLFMNIFASFFDGCTMGLIDAGVVCRITLSKEKKDFGWNRAFGGFGFAGGSLISGVVINYFPEVNVNCYTAIFIVYFVCTVGLLASSCFLFQTKKTESKENDVPNCNTTKPDSMKLLFTILSKVDVVLFFLTVFMVGTQQSIFVSFTTVRLQEMNTSSEIQGLTFSIAGLSCVVSIALSTRIIKLFRGTWNTLIVCSLTYTARFLLFANLENPILAIPISLFQSFGLGVFIAGSVHHVKAIAPEGLNTTLYSMMNGMYFGIGFIFGNIVGGQIFQNYGSQLLFTAAAFVIAAWSTILICYRVVVRFRNREDVPAPSV